MRVNCSDPPGLQRALPLPADVAALPAAFQVCITIIDTIIPNIHTNDAYTYDTYDTRTPLPSDVAALPTAFQFSNTSGGSSFVVRGGTLGTSALNPLFLLYNYALNPLYCL
jgi:hypothetical protein